jgi:serine/threonine protein kinase
MASCPFVRTGGALGSLFADFSSASARLGYPCLWGPEWGAQNDDMNNRATSSESTAEDRFRIVGKVVARTYRIESVVAEGGFGVVYRADHKGFRAKVALKCLKIPGTFNEAER